MFGSELFYESYLQYLVDSKVLDETMALSILDQVRANTPAIGRLALKTGVLNMNQVFRILGDQAESGERFGEIAIKLGFLNEKQLKTLLELQMQKRPSINEFIIEMQIVDKFTLEKHQLDFLDSVKACVV